MKKFAFSTAALLLTAGSAFGGTAIWGIEQTTPRLYNTTTNNFSGDLNFPGPTGLGFTGALDFDASATNLWAIENTSRRIGTFNFATGAFIDSGNTLVGVVDDASGISAHPTNGNWYLVTTNVTTSSLFVGDITTGVFSLVGAMPNVAGAIDLAIDSQGNAYTVDIVTDQLFGVDLATGNTNLIGPTGIDHNFGQGMDFDWSDDTLYMTAFNNTTFTTQFRSIDTTTGASTLIADIGFAQMELGIQSAVPAPGAIALLGLAGLAARRRRRA